MTLIEGIGDEIIHFLILIGSLIIALVAWWSTNISERPLLRTVLILERRGARHTAADTQSTLDLRDTTEVPSETNESETENKNSESVSETNNPLEMNVVDNIIVSSEEIQSTITDVDEASKPESPSTEGSDEAQSVNRTEDESSVVRNRRIAFFKNKEESGEGQSQQSQQIKNTTENNSTSNNSEAHSSDEGNIRIRLKYLNDDLKMVEGKLQEQLGDFKRRHFSLELAGRKLVRLIFNGKVLQQDTKTLQNYGFFDNCVVHCLVHQPRTPPPSPNLNRSRSERSTQSETVRHWDLGNILFASLSVLLCLAWYGRYQYAQLYTATTTVALIGLTGMFTVSFIGMYMPDVDGIRTH